MNDDLLANSFERLLQQHCAPNQVRDMEAGGDAKPLWQEIEQSGFADALLAEDQGGSGLSLADVGPILFLSGRHAVPIPLGQTMVVRAAVAAAGLDAPDGMVALAGGAAQWGDGGGVRCENVMSGGVADWVLVEHDGSAILLPTEPARITASGSCDRLSANLDWDEIPPKAVRLQTPPDWRAVGAVIFAAQLAGAMDKAMELTVQYANDRAQFGRPISKFQAIQQQISVMAEETYAAKMAAEMGCRTDRAWPDLMLAAVAKSRTSEAAAVVASIAHGVHGAIGVTHEFDLQLYTRRLHEWRSAFGGQSYWNRKIGEAMIGADSPRALDFIRQRLSC